MTPGKSLLLAAVALASGSGTAVGAEIGDTTLDLYGFAMLDTGYQSGQNDPDWFDVLRPTKLPAFADEFGEDGEWFVEDLGSTNGTYLNDRRVVQPVGVHAGDVVKVGKTVLELRR